MCFLSKKDSQVRKKVYLTAIYGCHQAMKDVLSIADVLLAQFKLNNSLIENLYAISDNAGSYHGALVPEALFKICKANNFNLKWYDYNEPCKGKDRCNCESAGAKNLMRGYVDAGNDIITALDTVTALKHGNGLRNAKASTIEINTDKTNLESEEIPKLHMYHSIPFRDTCMLLQMYYNIGKCVIQPYGNVRFTSSNNVIVPFTSTSEVSFQPLSKKRVDRSLCTLLFCTEYGCGQVFENSIDYENYQLQGCQLLFIKTYAMDKVKNAFAAWMVSSSELYFTNTARVYIS